MDQYVQSVDIIFFLCLINIMCPFSITFTPQLLKNFSRNQFETKKLDGIFLSCFILHHSYQQCYLKCMKSVSIKETFIIYHNENL